MWPPKWFTKIFRNFHIAPYIYGGTGGWHPAYTHTKTKTYTKNTFTELY